MLGALYNKPNRIVEKQKLVQSQHSAVYYRLPRSRFYVTSYYAIFTVGMLSTTYGIFQLIKGKGASA